MQTQSINDFKNIHEGETCVIIGGGPSLIDFDLSSLSYPTFATNCIFLLDYTPTYYCIEDWLVATDRKKEIENIDTIRFYGSHLKNILTDGIWIETNTMASNHPYIPQFSLDLSKIIFTGHTVTYMCFQIAFWMGFTKVFLLGMDHNYKIPKTANRIRGAVYKSFGDDPNHYHVDYFGAGFRFHDPKPERMERAYSRAKEVFEHYGRKIYNATPNSLLTVFERRSID